MPPPSLQSGEFELHITSYEKFIMFINVLKGGDVVIDEDLDALRIRLRNGRIKLQAAVDKNSVQEG